MNFASFLISLGTKRLCILATSKSADATTRERSSRRQADDRSARHPPDQTQGNLTADEEHLLQQLLLDLRLRYVRETGR